MLVWVLCGGGSSVQHRVYTITPTITTHSNIRYSVVFYKSYDFFELDFIVVRWPENFSGHKSGQGRHAFHMLNLGVERVFRLMLLVA